jgi:carnitine 3-dehydrogenase
MDVPELDEALLERLVSQSDAQARGASMRELERQRDDCLIAVLHGLRSANYGAGRVLADYEKALLDRADRPEPEAADPTQPLRIHDCVIPTDWVDYNGHTNDARYAQLSCDASDVLLRMIGLDAEHLAGGHSWFTVEAHISYLAQSRAGDPVYVTTQIIGHSPKKLHVFNRMHLAADDTLIATGEHLYLYVDTRTDKTVDAPADMQARIAAIAAPHAALPEPPQAGRFVGAPRVS